MFNSQLPDNVHRRYNPLTGEWVLVSPHRNKRPWNGKIEKTNLEEKLPYDPACYLCPGNVRAGGKENPEYENIFVFDNDYAALQTDIHAFEYEKGNLIKAKSEQGKCRVICFSSLHNLSIPQMDVKHIKKVVEAWCSEYKELGKENNINYIQIFENKGEIMGCSNPHPHGQIWAQETIPDMPLKESEMQLKYFNKFGKSMLSDYLEEEIEIRERIVLSNNSFVVLVPFWAIWPFETMVVSKRHIQNITQFTEEEKMDLAEIYKILTIKYDNLFETSFPYSAGIHQSPTDGNKNQEWHFHMHFYPPLLRSATVKKFMVGYEMLANPQRDITAEQSAEKLRRLSNVHFTKNNLLNL